MGSKQRKLPEHCKPGYHCLQCPYPQCIRPSWADTATKEEGYMLACAGMLYKRKKRAERMARLCSK